MLSLALDTAFGHLAFALQRDTEVLAQHYALTRRRNASALFELLDPAFQDLRLTIQDVDLFIVNQGPGSYTGVRIGMSVIKTLAQVRRKPLVAVNALELLAAQAEPAEEPFPVLLNCTRREVFVAEAHHDGSAVRLLDAPTLSRWEDLSAAVTERPGIFHSIAPQPDPAFAVLPQRPRRTLAPDATLLTQLGRTRLEQHGPDAFDRVHPLYLKRDVEKRQLAGPA